MAHFDQYNGGNPNGGMVFDTSGNLYGATTTHGSGAASGAWGSVFKLPVGTNNITPLFRFDGTNGWDPCGRLAITDDGNIYGTTTGGGTFGSGTAFCISLRTGGFISVFSFDQSDGFSFGMDSEACGIILNSADGQLYGATERGWSGYTTAGKVFRIDPTTHNLTKLATFDGYNTGGVPSNLIFSSSGDILGTTFSGGDNEGGTVFRIAPGSNLLTVLVAAPFYSHPMGLVREASGDLYGVTYYNGDYGKGMIFMVNGHTNTFTCLKSFSGSNGAYPVCLVADGNGNLYGATSNGGAFDMGTVFTFSPQSGVFSTLATFAGGNSQGAHPNGLVFDASGNLWGTTANGGQRNNGTVFEIDLVPEPATLFLFALGCPVVIRRRLALP